MDIKIIGLFLLGLGILLGLVVFDAVAFSVLFDTGFFRWYLQNGSLINLLSALMAKLIRRADDDIGLIAANPFLYIGSYMKLVGRRVGLSAAVAGHIGESSDYLGDLLKRHPNLSVVQSVAVAVDFFLAGVAVILLAITAFFWMIVVLPAQYFVYLVCGALPRYVSRIELDEPPGESRASKGNGPARRARLVDWANDIRHVQGQIVSLTAVISAIVLFFLNAIVID